MNIISAAAELLKGDIKCITQDMTGYVKTDKLKNFEENLNYPPTDSEVLPRDLVRGQKY